MPVMGRLTFWLLSLVLMFGLRGLGQTTKPTVETGYADVNQEHAAWPSPESVLGDLRSTNIDARLKALKTAGLTEQQAHEAIWSVGKVAPSKITGGAVIAPDRVELVYAALGEGSEQQAVLAFEVSSQRHSYAAIAVPRGKVWERIALIDCWCKYDVELSQDALAEFVSLRPVPQPEPSGAQHYELVVHSSGGGTGIYTQYEAHFRIYRGALRQVLLFTSAFHSNDPTSPKASTVQIERRWFTTEILGSSAFGGTLVEAKGKFPADQYPEIQWTVKPLLDMHLQEVSCRQYRWDATTFRYEPLDAKMAACPVRQE